VSGCTPVSWATPSVLRRVEASCATTGSFCDDTLASDVTSADKAVSILEVEVSTTCTL